MISPCQFPSICVNILSHSLSHSVTGNIKLVCVLQLSRSYIRTIGLFSLFTLSRSKGWLALALVPSVRRLCVRASPRPDPAVLVCKLSTWNLQPSGSPFDYPPVLASDDSCSCICLPVLVAVWVSSLISVCVCAHEGSCWNEFKMIKMMKLLLLDEFKMSSAEVVRVNWGLQSRLWILELPVGHRSFLLPFQCARRSTRWLVDSFSERSTAEDSPGDRRVLDEFEYLDRAILELGII